MSLILGPPSFAIRKARATSTDPLTLAADAAAPRVRRWWRELWEDFQGALPLTWALSSLETVLREAWQTHALPRFEALDALLRTLAQAVTSAVLPPLSPDALGITQAVQAIETSLAQVPTTMARLPQGLLPDVAVLTIPQQGALVRMAEGFAAEPMTPPAHVERALWTQARAQLKVRTEGLTGQMTWTSAQAGQQAGWQQQAQRGELGTGVRRYWRVRHDERLCPRCAVIPGLNEGGVGLEEPFITTEEPAMHPPRHLACRCNVEIH